MSNINPIFFDRVRYILTSKNFDSLIVTEPLGWNDDEKEYSRHEIYHGIIAKFSNSLKFIDSGADYIQLVYDIDGINAEVKLTREEKHPKTDVWTLSYSGHLDLSTWQRENNQVSVKFNSGGLEQLLKSREGEKVEIDRLTTIDGKAIPPLPIINVELDGRKIFLKTKFTVKDTNNTVYMSNFSNGNTRGSTTSVPLLLVNQSHENAHSPITGTVVGDNSGDRTGKGETANMFFAVSDVERTMRIKFTLKFKVNITRFDDVNHFAFYCRLATYENGIDYNLKNNIFLYSNSNNYNTLNGKTFSVSFDQLITIEAGDSLALEFDQYADLGSNTSRGHIDINVSNIECDLFVDEDSSFEKTISKAILIHELVDRLVTISTNQETSFYSDFLGRTDIGYPIDGKAGLVACTHGFWVRKFDKLPIPVDGPPKIENLFKPLTTSFKDAVGSIDAVFNIGIGIEKIGFNERVRLEELSFFFNKNVTIILPNQVKNLKRTVAIDKYYSTLEFGYEQGGDYEEACGLDEYNAKSNFTTIINRVKGVYTKISKIRADMYGLEFARRKPKSLNDTEDTSYDNSTWFLDLKRYLPGVFKQRLWQDDFDKEPTGVFSPETATNLRFSPFNCLLRHSWWFSGGLKKYLSDYTRYGSSTANSQLKTKFIGRNEYSENGDIVNSELEKARFIPEEIEFEHICDFDVIQQINGTTTILGKKIVNFYGLVEFINERNEIEKGYLLNLKPNGKGQWKLLKFNR